LNKKGLCNWGSAGGAHREGESSTVLNLQRLFGGRNTRRGKVYMGKKNSNGGRGKSRGRNLVRIPGIMWHKRGGGGGSRQKEGPEEGGKWPFQWSRASTGKDEVPNPGNRV